MSKLDELMLEKFDSQLMGYQEEKELRVELNKFYNQMVNDKPSVKYIVSAWILDNDKLIKELDISIQFVQEEKSEFIKNYGLLNGNKTV